jgi:hypothetical protein
MRGISLASNELDLRGLPQHLRDALQWVEGKPVLVLDNKLESHRRDLELWALMNHVYMVFVPHGQVSTKEHGVIAINAAAMRIGANRRSQ